MVLLMVFYQTKQLVTLLLKAETRKSRWQELNGINEKAKDLPKRHRFSIGIDHGKEINDGKYAYFVYLENEFSKRKMKKPNLKILSNTTKLQAASTKNENIISAVFYDNNSILSTKKGQIKVSVPAVIMLEENKNSWNLSVTDPTMDKNLKTIEVNTTITCERLKCIQERWLV